MKVTALFEYPVKALSGISLDTAVVNKRGLGLDRRYMLVDTKNQFLTQRELPELTQFDVEIDHNLSFRVKNENDEISLAANAIGKRVEVRVWDDSVMAQEVNPQFNEWFSDKLNQDVRLVFMGDNDHRPTDPAYSELGDEVGFADGFPILIASESSLAELNRRLTNPVAMDRFRANIVVDGDLPFAEDQWQTINIGDVVLRAAKPCGRCQVITIDQTTGKREAEPLTELAKFRKSGNKVLFGLNVIPENMGVVKVGQLVTTI